MNTETKRKVREATRVFERGYRRDEEVDVRLKTRGQKDEAFKRRTERLSRELEACEGQEAKREVLRKFEVRMKREGYTADEVAEALRDVRRKSKERRDAEASITKEKHKPFGGEPSDTAPDWGKDDADDAAADDDQEEDE